MEPAKRKKTILLILYTVALLSPFLLHFTIIDFNDQKILVYALFDPIKRIYMSYDIYPRVIGRYKLKTEFGEITIKSFLKLTVDYHTFGRLKNEDFKSGRAVHNLEVKGIVLPKDIYIVFFEGRIEEIWIGEDAHEKILVSGKTLAIGDIRNTYNRFGNRPYIRIRAYTEGTQEITLSDSTHIMDFVRSWYLYLNEDETWSIDLHGGSSFLVKLPGEKEYQRCKSITFKKDWGEFISGEFYSPR